MKQRVAILWLKSMIIFLISCETNGQADHEVSVQNESVREIQLKTGAEQTEKYLGLIEKQRVVVVANPTSVIGKTHLVDSLLSLGIQIQKVFAPEHGFRGDADAGAHIENEIDERTKIPIISLYGKNMKPSSENMTGIDVIIFDIQDVGARFYTYISTLHYVMEACAEHDVKLIVLDRPNPNGDIVDGPVLDTNFSSFVGMHPVPVLHGMTIGEYARMINGEGWLKNNVQCKLTVIGCDNYTHQTRYSLPIAPSPNLRTDKAIELYASLCFFEGTVVSVGRGTDRPFELYAHPNFPSDLPVIVPKSVKGASDPLWANTKCRMYQLSDDTALDRELHLEYLLNAYNILGDKLFKYKSFFDKLAGTDELRKQLISGKTEQEIRQSWETDLSNYQKTRLKYLLYDL